MIRIGVALLGMVIGGSAHAQPAPRVALDVNLAPADGFTLQGYPQRGRLAVGSDGTSFVLLHQFVKEQRAQVDLLALARDGTVRFRRVLPVQEKVGYEGFAISSLGITVARTGELAVFWSPNDTMTDGPRPGRNFGTLLRIGADGSVKKRSALGPPSRKHGREDPNGYYEIEVFESTPDNGLLLGGGFGSGPYAWWMGKFSLDGVRLWQAGPGNGFPERVGAIGRRPDGSWISLVTEMQPRGGLDWFIRRNAADGKLLARHRVAVPIEQAAAVLADSSVLAPGSDQTTRRNELVFVDDGGRILRRVPWPFPQTWRLIADGEGIAAMVVDSPDLDGKHYVVRADARGVIRWRSPAMDVADIVRTPDGQIAALVRAGQDREVLHLVRFADP